MSEDTLEAHRAVRQDIGRRIRQAREAKGWTQAMLGGAWGGVSHAAISERERGLTGLEVYDLMRAAAILETDWHTLLPDGPTPEQVEPQGPGGMAEQEQDTASMVYHAARLAMAECRVFNAETQRLIGTAIERGVMAGLRSWGQGNG